MGGPTCLCVPGRARNDKDRGTRRNRRERPAPTPACLQTEPEQRALICADVLLLWLCSGDKVLVTVETPSQQRLSNQWWRPSSSSSLPARPLGTFSDPPPPAPAPAAPGEPYFPPRDSECLTTSFTRGLLGRENREAYKRIEFMAASSLGAVLWTPEPKDLGSVPRHITY